MFETFLGDRTVQLYNAKKWLEVKIFGVPSTEVHEGFEITSRDQQKTMHGSINGDTMSIWRCQVNVNTQIYFSG